MEAPGHRRPIPLLFMGLITTELGHIELTLTFSKWHPTLWQHCALFMGTRKVSNIFKLMCYFLFIHFRWTDTKKRGQLCGVGGDAGDKRFGALFVLCIRENPNDHFRCPFGSVIRGMEILDKIANMENVEAVQISECGAVITIE